MSTERKLRLGRESQARYRRSHPDRIRAYKIRPEVREAENGRMRQRRAIRNVEQRARDNEKMRAANLERLYGITPEQYDEQLAKQNGRCAICTSDNPGHTISNRFHVDHDHKTGKFRGLLCGHCNRGLGAFKDKPHVLRAAIEYLNVRVTR
jgi:hypothetical protein